MVQSVKWWPCRQENLNLIPRPTVKSLEQKCTPVTQHLENVDRRNLGLAGQLAQ